MQTNTERQNTLFVSEFSWEQKRRYYELWESSGLSKSAFCAEKGLSVAAFYKWCRKFRERDVADKDQKFLPLKISEPEKESLANKNIEIKTRVGYLIRFSPENMSATIIEWIRMLDNEAENRVK